MDPETIIKTIKSLETNFTQEIDIYKAIYELTVKENESILSGSIDKTLEYVKQKQDLLLKIENIERDQLAVKKIWSECRHQVPEKSKLIIKEKLSLLSALLEQLIDLEKKNEIVLSETILRVKSQKTYPSTPSINAAEAYKDKNRNLRNN